MVKFLIGNIRRMRWAGIARVAAYLGLVNVGFSYLLMRSAYAGAEKAVQRLGSQLTKELGANLLGQPQAVSVNGQLLFFAAKETELPVKAVLDRFDAHCQAHSGGLREQFAKVPGFEQRKLALPEDLRDPGRIGIIRSDAGHASASETEAHLVCIAQPGDGGVKGLVQHVNEFLASGDASRIGDMRYVAARKLDNGHTQVIAIWTEGAFNIEAMFPDAGDAPGSDAPDVPRPPAAVRRLSAVMPDHPYAVRFYDSTESSAQVLSFYDRQLTAANWATRPSSLDPNGQPELRGAAARAFSRDGRALLVAVNQEAPGQTSVSVIELGTLERVVAEAVTPK